MKKEIQKIADRMGDAYGFQSVNANAILGKSREKNIVHIRKILLAVLEDTTKYSRTEIAARFNRTYQQIFNLIKDGRKKNELAINAIKGDLDLKDFVEKIEISSVAIGGINFSNFQKVKRSGVDMIAMSSELFLQKEMPELELFYRNE